MLEGWGVRELSWHRGGTYLSLGPREVFLEKLILKQISAR